MESNGRRTGTLALFGALALSVLLLFINLDALIGVPPRRDHRSRTPAVDAAEWALWQKLAAAPRDGRELLKDEYQTVTAEIRQRLNDEHLLFALKFALIGAILVTALQGSRGKKLQANAFTALLAWAAVITASIVDLRIAANQAFLRTLGGWVRRYEELTLGSAVGFGWEAYLADQGVHAGVRLSGQVLTALLFIVTAALFLARRNSDAVTAQLSGAGAVVSIVLMTLSAIGFPLTTAEASRAVTYGSLGAAAVAVALSLAVASPAARPAPPPDAP